MTGGAGGPDRPSRGGERPPESAAFEPARVGGARRTRPPLVASAFMLVLVLVVAAGVSGRLSPGPFPKDVVLASPAATPAGPVVSLPLPPDASDRPAFPADTGPIYTSAPGPMAIQAKRHPQTIFVHGDVEGERVTWVYVGVLDDVGRVAGWTSVSVPGTVGPSASGGPALRFDVELAIPYDFQGRLWVRAVAYGPDGKVVASSNVEIPVAGS